MGHPSPWSGVGRFQSEELALDLTGLDCQPDEDGSLGGRVERGENTL